MLWRVVLTLKISPELSKVKPEKVPPTSFLSLARFTRVRLLICRYLGSISVSTCLCRCSWMVDGKQIWYSSLTFTSCPEPTRRLSFCLIRSGPDALSCCHLSSCHFSSPFLFSVRCIYLHGLFSWYPLPKSTGVSSLNLCIRFNDTSKIISAITLLPDTLQQPFSALSFFINVCNL